MKRHEENAKEMFHSYRSCYILAKDRSHYLMLHTPIDNQRMEATKIDAKGVHGEDITITCKQLARDYQLAGVASSYFQAGPICYLLKKGTHRQYCKGLGNDTHRVMLHTQDIWTQRWLKERMNFTSKARFGKHKDHFRYIKSKYTTFSKALQTLHNKDSRTISVALTPSYAMGLELGVAHPLLYHKGQSIGTCADGGINLFRAFGYMKECIQRELKVKKVVTC